ncbi:hypothetical protein C5C66_09430 [Rathayibacter toxicus]|uniref:Uncharacterized protein n=1 Tax=Rathayibacter toxicus TaxID=145458 RepID=A0A0C5BG95_9MICO|nr:hypothetical protein TI83_09565 [Rathayibacter toxicus]ALS57630.1 hypothetical protein APU90_07500 [Rathayibacter toxicus]KKM44982.1 hypothetical protein VT73_07665 [Rathayibacter toxicus]PPG20700.1 hypothetical protein C5D15_09425 [Rathayibacter toxicus]PPG45804.1 hypothetical protein C5D16_09390 [Rathayibacter toxicus]
MRTLLGVSHSQVASRARFGARSQNAAICSTWPSPHRTETEIADESQEDFLPSHYPSRDIHPLAEYTDIFTA